MEGIPRLIELMAEMLEEQRQTNAKLGSMNERIESMDNRMETTYRRHHS